MFCDHVITSEPIILFSVNRIFWTNQNIVSKRFYTAFFKGWKPIRTSYYFHRLRQCRAFCFPWAESFIPHPPLSRPAAAALLLVQCPCWASGLWNGTWAKSWICSGCILPSIYLLTQYIYTSCKRNFFWCLLAKHVDFLILPRGQSKVLFKSACSWRSGYQGFELSKKKKKFLRLSWSHPWSENLQLLHYFTAIIVSDKNLLLKTVRSDQRWWLFGVIVPSGSTKHYLPCQRILFSGFVGVKMGGIVACAHEKGNAI